MWYSRPSAPNADSINYSGVHGGYSTTTTGGR